MLQFRAAIVASFVTIIPPGPVRASPEAAIIPLSEIRGRLARHPGWTIFGLALAVRLPALLLADSLRLEPLNKDAMLYHLLAQALVKGEGLSQAGQPTAVTGPLYPLFLAAVYRLAGESRIAVLLCQALLGAALAVYLQRLGRLLFSPRAGWIAGLAGCLYWPFLVVGMRYQSEALFLPLVLAALYHLARGTAEASRRQSLLAALLLGLAVLTRPVVFYFAFLPPLLLALRSLRGRSFRPALLGLAFLALFLLVLAPWAIRNQRVFGRPVFTTTNSGMVLYSGNFPHQGKIFGRNLRESELPPEQRYILGLPEGERDLALAKLAKAKLKADPGRIPGLLALKAAYFWSPFDWEVLGDSQGRLNPWYLWLMVFALCWLPSARPRSELVLPLAFVGYSFLLCLAAYGSPRLRLPVEPVLLVLAAQGGLLLRDRLGRWGRLALALTVVLTLAAGQHYGGQAKELGAAVLSGAGLW